MAAVFSVIMLGRKLTTLKWIALFMLMVRRTTLGLLLTLMTRENERTRARELERALLWSS